MSADKQSVDKQDGYYSMSRDEQLDLYKIPREAVDVEALAQHCARYSIYASEDSLFLGNDWTRRDQIYAILCNDPQINPHRDIGPGAHLDDYLDPVDAQLAALTPPKTVELATDALAVFREYKLSRGLLNHPDLKVQVCMRCKMSDTPLRADMRLPLISQTAWLKNKYGPFVVQEPQSEFPSVASLQQVLPASTLPPSRDPSTSTSNTLQQAEIDNLLNTGAPSDILEYQFFYRPYTDEGIIWEVEKYTISRGGDIVYEVRFVGGSDDLMPMDQDEVRLML
ncbi:hypothetical protein OG21DRAFT_1505694 [Imleria badia]|nr:hypothetical protein OG21DRAFT_1505694 [Imleria badia]